MLVLKRRGCGCGPKKCKLLGWILIALGIGIFLAHWLPYYLLITLLGLALIVFGVWNLLGKF